MKKPKKYYADYVVFTKQIPKETATIIDNYCLEKTKESAGGKSYKRGDFLADLIDKFIKELHNERNSPSE